MKNKLIISVVGFLVFVVAFLGLFIVFSYNGYVRTEKKVEEAKAQIATVCQRRLDLLPNLIEAVKAYASHEKETLTSVIQARQNAKNILDSLGKEGALSKEEIMQLQATQTKVTSAFRGIFALAESYPNLKASSNFMALQDQFEGTENRISVARQRYNSSVRKFNTKIEIFPGVFLAPMFGFEEKDFFEAKEEVYEPVKAAF